MFEIGQRYVLTLQDGPEAEEYRHGIVTAQEGVVISFTDDDGGRYIINTSSAKFIQAQLERW